MNNFSIIDSLDLSWLSNQDGTNLTLAFDQASTHHELKVIEQESTSSWTVVGDRICAFDEVEKAKHYAEFSVKEDIVLCTADLVGLISQGNNFGLGYEIPTIKVGLHLLANYIRDFIDVTQEIEVIICAGLFRPLSPRNKSINKPCYRPELNDTVTLLVKHYEKSYRATLSLPTSLIEIKQQVRAHLDLGEHQPNGLDIELYA